MTETKTTTLTPQEWKNLCLLNVAQLHSFLQGIEAPTDEHFALIEQQLARGNSFLRAWSKSRPLTQEPVQQAAPVKPDANGAMPKKPGWPKEKTNAQVHSARGDAVKRALMGSVCPYALRLPAMTARQMADILSHAYHSLGLQHLDPK